VSVFQEITEGHRKKIVRKVDVLFAGSSGTDVLEVDASTGLSGD
jgi:hypothetical protein